MGKILKYRIHRIGDTLYEVLFNDVKVGYIYQEVDGKFVFIQTQNGYLDSYSLKKIAETLDNLMNEN